MHQKSTATASTQSADAENEEERRDAGHEQETDSVLRNPFEDDGEDEVNDDSDDSLGEDGANIDVWGTQTSRGGWWRNTVHRNPERFGDGRDDSDSDKEDRAEADDDDDDEFGDFAMPETDKDNSPGKAGVIVKPLPVHPPSHNPKSSAFTSLWPFGSKEKEKEREREREKSKGEEPAMAAATTSAESAGGAETQDHENIKITHEATRRMSIEDPDDDEVVL